MPWESGIYPAFKGPERHEEAAFFADLIVRVGARRILDLGVGNGQDLSGILRVLQARGHETGAEANEVEPVFFRQASARFRKQGQHVLLHRANWVDLPAASPAYEGQFDFAYLTGNSLTYIGGGTRAYTKRAQASIVRKFAQLVRPGGRLLIDARNYDYIRALMHLPRDRVFEAFTFEKTVYYHGDVLVFPAYISDTVVVLHYYDRARRVWSKLDLYPIYQRDMADILRKDFVIERVLHDFGPARRKSLFVQWLCRRRG